MKYFMDGHTEESREPTGISLGSTLWEDGHLFMWQGHGWVEQEPQYSSYQLMKKLDEILSLLKIERAREG